MILRHDMTKEISRQVFSCGIRKIFKNTFFKKTKIFLLLIIYSKIGND